MFKLNSEFKHIQLLNFDLALSFWLGGKTKVIDKGVMCLLIRQWIPESIGIDKANSKMLSQIDNKKPSGS